MGLFITFEGVEGCGKSTQARLLVNQLEASGVSVLHTHEPGVTALGERITELLKWSDDVPISPVAELLLFNVSRAQLIEEVVRPALKKGSIVVCDRYSDSTTAYQGYARGLDMDMVLAANAIGTRGIIPDLTILLDVPPEHGMERKNGTKLDRFEVETADFHRRVQKGYHKLAEQEPKRWMVIDGTLEKNIVQDIIWQRVQSLVFQGT